MDSADRLQIELAPQKRWLRVFAGVCIVLTGLTVAAFCVYASRARPDSFTGPLWLNVALGLLSVPVGAFVALLRMVRVVDRRAGTVTTWWGLPKPLRSTVQSLEGYNEVTVSRRMIRSNSTSVPIYEVTLTGAGQPIIWRRSSVVHEARQWAKDLAKFLGWGLRDTSADETVVRPADVLDETYRARAAREGVTVEWPEMPQECRVSYETRGEEAVIDLPVTGFRAVHAVKLARGAFTTVVGCTVLFQTSADPFGWGLPGMIVTALLGLALFLQYFLTVGTPVIIAAAARHRLTVSHQGLRLERRHLLGGKTWWLAADALRELEIGRPEAGRRKSRFVKPLRGIIAHDDSTTCTFGEGLTDQELRWVHDVTRYILLDVPEQRREAPEPSVPADAALAAV